MSQIDDLFEKIGKFVLKQTDFSFERVQTIIKSHTEKLSQTGDISFPTTVQPWLNSIKNSDDWKDYKQIINGDDDEFAEKLIKASSEWKFPIETVKFKQFRCLLFLDRPKSYRNMLKTVLYDNALYGQWNRTNGSTIYAVKFAQQSNDNSLIEHRCRLVTKVLTNLLEVSGFKMVSTLDELGIDSKNMVEILISCARRDDPKRAPRQRDVELNNNNKSRLIVCGSVTSKLANSADDIIRLRSSDMERLAESKYGQHNENAALEMCHKLGAAIVTFDLLKFKNFNAIDLDKLVPTASAVKGAAFVLYNFARLHTLLASFDQQVARGFYAPLPNFDDVDFGLLKTEEEWQMFYVYIVGFPSMLERCVIGIDNGQIAIHLLCTYLSNLSALFSAYYHRIKILTDNLPQLMPVMYARVYFLKALRHIFLKSLTILEIEPLQEM